MQDKPPEQVPAHVSPAPGAGPQTPQPLLPLQAALWHWSSSVQAAPLDSDPALKRHAASTVGSKANH
jgi:hypothetical protein